MVQQMQHNKINLHFSHGFFPTGEFIFLPDSYS